MVPYEMAVGKLSTHDPVVRECLDHYRRRRRSRLGQWEAQGLGLIRVSHRKRQINIANTIEPDELSGLVLFKIATPA